MNTAEEVLKMLRGRTKVSGEDIAEAVGLSRTAIWKAINHLRELGYDIEGDAKGYTLVSAPDILFPYELTPLLKTKYMGRRMEHAMSVGSTNEMVRQLAEAGWPHGGMFVAEQQETGKGRLGRQWVSPKGGIWFSVILRPDLPPSEAPVLTLAGGVAVAEALAVHGFDARLKWPNDILIGEKKVCGILTEMSGEMERIGYIVMGVGLNANFKVDELPKDVRGKATSLLDEKGSPVDRKVLITDILKLLEGLVNKGPKEILTRWKARSATIGKRVRIQTQKGAIEGMAKDLDKSGALVLKLDSGEEQTIYSGDCEHLRDAK